ncbi:protein kinase [Streptomyces sp. NPDC005566]|uniref:serine/threonine-protein kinase n=1 Tax=Streptomyces sp. NPDC005566 TaxID=3156886 RepID=UPI0033B4B62B
MEKLGSGDPQRIGAYRLLGRLGAGGMGQVYLARSERGRTVAIKLVRPDLAEVQQFRDRFRQEVQAGRRVGGAWTAPVLDADIDAPVPWVATGYVAGPSLQRTVSGVPGTPVAASGAYGPLPARTVRILGAGLASALQDIHRAGLIHRDLKPSNILMTIDGPRVIDFGIARALDTVTDGGLTRTGALIGSPGFMAPEQVRGERVTAACDVFCLGSVLAYASTGRLPFGVADSGVHALMFRIAQEDPDLTGVPADLVELIRDCLAKDPAARPSTDSVLDRLGGPETGEPWLPGALIAQLGRHAVELLDSEDPEEGPAPTPAGPVPPAPPATPPTPQLPPGQASQLPPGQVQVPQPAPGRTPQLPPGQALQSPPGSAQAPQAPPDRPAHTLPTMIGPPTPPPQTRTPPAYGHPQPPAQGYGHPQSPAPAPGYGYPQPPAQGYRPTPTYGATPPYGPPPYLAPSSAPEPERRRSAGSVLLLVAVALIVAVGVGWSVYAFMKDGDGHTTSSPDPTPEPTSSRSVSPSPSGPDPSPSADGKSGEGAVPTGYLGTWSGTIDSASGQSTRQLVIQQGEVGDTVLSLTAEGPLDTGGSYHCVFQAPLRSEPSSGSPVSIGPSTVSVGEPMASCTPGKPTVLTLLPDGTLRREATDTGESLTYTRTD